MVKVDDVSNSSFIFADVVEQTVLSGKIDCGVDEIKMVVKTKQGNSTSKFMTGLGLGSVTGLTNDETVEVSFTDPLFSGDNSYKISMWVK